MTSFFLKDESDEIFMHFMQTNGSATNVRNKNTILKNGKRVFEDDETNGNTGKKAKLSRPPQNVLKLCPQIVVD